MSTLIGLKLWSSNGVWFPEAVQMFKNNNIDFIELYVAPEPPDQNQLQLLDGVPITIHAPHENHAFNTSDLTRAAVSRFHDEVIPLANTLNATHIVVHGGIGTSTSAFSEEIKKISDPRLIIENMPKMSLDEHVCFGHSASEIRYIHDTLGFSICFDLGHAIKSAFSQGLEYKDFLRKILTISNATYFHLSDGDSQTAIDNHLSLGSGNFDLGFLKELIRSQSSSQDVRVVFEVPKNNVNLAGDLENIEFFHQIS